MLAAEQMAQAAIVVSSYRAVASTNAFAPLDKSNYFDEHIVQNQPNVDISAFGDWVGTNYASSTNTWHWVGSARTKVTTHSEPTILTVSGLGSFSREMVTTIDFVSPSNETLLYGPRSASSYSIDFAVDESSRFALSTILGRFASVGIYSYALGSYLFVQGNAGVEPVEVSVDGELIPGSYSLGIGANYGGTIGVGQSQQLYKGSFTDFVFTVQVPEPSFAVTFILALGCRRRLALSQ